MPVDLSTPDASQFVSYEAEDDNKEIDTLKRSSRRLRRRSDNTGGDGEDHDEKPKIVAKTSVGTKYLSGTYSGEGSTTIFPFYNDLKIAYMTRIKDIPIGSRAYVELSDVFRFTVDLILREGVRFSLLSPEDLSKDEQIPIPIGSTVAEEQIAELEEEYDNEVLKGFHKIYSDVVEQYGEAFIIHTKNGPLFTSLDGKSAFDSRDTLSGPPPGVQMNLNTTKILPQAPPLSTYQLSYISPIISSVPHPSIPPTALMWGFTHPNAVPLPVPKYLKYDEQQSFAPTIDGSNSMIDKSLMDSVWYQKYTQRRMITENALVSLLSGKEVEREENDEDVEMGNAKEEQDGKAEDSEEKESTETAVSAREIEGLTSSDFEDALLWSPNNFIDDDELEAAREGTEIQLISRLILELQTKQRTRLSKTDDTKFIIPADERRLAAKIQNGITRLLDQEEITPAELGIMPDAKFPVLQASYMGTLPVPVVSASIQAQIPTAKRYQSRPNRRR